MKKQIFFILGLLAILNAEEINIEEHIKVYEVPLQYSATIKDIEQKGILQKEKVFKKDDKNIINSKNVMIYFKKNHTDERKFQILLKELYKLAKNKNIKNKEATLETLQILFQLHQD